MASSHPKTEKRVFDSEEDLAVSLAKYIADLSHHFANKKRLFTVVLSSNASSFLYSDSLCLLWTMCNRSCSKFGNYTCFCSFFGSFNNCKTTITSGIFNPLIFLDLASYFWDIVWNIWWKFPCLWDIDSKGLASFSLSKMSGNWWNHPMLIPLTGRYVTYFGSMRELCPRLMLTTTTNSLMMVFSLRLY